MSSSSRISAEEITALAAAIANDLAKCKTADELLALRNLTSLISQNLLAIMTQRQINERSCKEERKNSFGSPG